ncbi:MAG: xanthine dehydrogenase family protein subunit M [Planctomycetota bacterium]|nr:MAG: xanthine dehydrogenase family protein subunit M [Planctomycetota bacterium]REJ93162.1 MAG: xanthine dehydrogenase family protein subunit M [Planctomycetota bacterium]REK21835.1 MAG: xanthine dehydrogenase family protein subunit M [Planctomycetota bacterium]REK37756.1 MAG: xanthine dehydrogenase family protein subunit M [Planctomycetota bacterium]
MRDFDYAAPATLQEAVTLFSRHNGAARALAGGTDLIDHVRTGRVTPDVVIDVKRIPELNRLEITPDGLRLGAAVPCWRIYESAEIRESYPALVDACSIIGGIQIQSRASVGGNLCNSGPAADTIPALIAHSAVCVIVGPEGEREVPVEQFCTGPGRNVLQPGEILVEMKLPAPPPRSGSHYRRFIPRNEMDIAVVGVGAAVTLDESGTSLVCGRIAVGAVAPTPLDAVDASNLLAGAPVDDETFQKAAAAARAIAVPIDDMRGTRDYRVHLTGVLTERVLREAVSRAQQAAGA